MTARSNSARENNCNIRLKMLDTRITAVVVLLSFTSRNANRSRVWRCRSNANFDKSPNEVTMEGQRRMKAAVYRRYGPPEVIQIQELEQPVPKDNQVLIRIHATTVSAADWRMRRAVPFIVRFMTGLWRPNKIQILGMEFSGTVESVGRAVTRFREGDQVFGSPGFKFGTHAEYICQPEDALLALKPVNMSFQEAAAVLFGGVSALHFLRKAHIQAGQHVLIYGRRGAWEYSLFNWPRLRCERHCSVQHRQPGPGEISRR